MKKLVSIALSLSILITPITSFGQEKSKDPSDVLYSTVIVLSDKSMGAGYIISDGISTYIATDAHVVKDEEYMRIIPYGTTDNYICKVIYTNAQTDVCLIRYPSVLNLKPLKLSTKPLKQFETVYTIGHPNNVFYSASKGIVSATNVTFSNNMVLNSFDLSVYYGSSGGCIYNSDNEVVGMVESYMDGGYALGIPNSDIQSAMNSVDIKPTFLNFSRCSFER